MPKAVLGSRAYALPPTSLHALHPELYEYLLLLHVRMFGMPAGATDTETRQGFGDLDEINIKGQLTDTIDHSQFTNLDQDTHLQYLTTARHAVITGNPHAVTAAEVGNAVAQWNANQLQGEPVSAATPAEGEALVYTAGVWTPGAGAGGGAVSSVFGRTGAVVAQANDYTWAQIDKTTSSLADLATRTHSALTGLDYASAAHTGFEPTVTKGNLTEAVSSVLTLTGGTGAVIGAGTTIQVTAASAGVSGYLTGTDWSTFNAKQAAGNYITALTADVTATGPGSVAATIAAGAVTLAKMADLATARLIGRNTAGTGVPESLTAATVKTMLALDLVENTALSTWAGSTNLTTLGTIATGTWNATVIADGKIAAALTGKTYNALTLTAQATGFTIAGGTVSKTLTVANDASVSGTNTGDQNDHAALANLSYATAAHTGFEPTVTKGNLTAGSAKITIGGTGTGALIGAGASVDVAEANLTHNNLGGLTTGDSHTQYALLAGRSGGQTLIGGTASGDDLTFQSTSHATKGTLFLDDSVELWPSFPNPPLGSTIYNLLLWDPAFTVSNAFPSVYGLHLNPTVTISSAVLGLSYSVIPGEGTFTTTVETMSVFTLFNALPIVTTATTNVRPMAPTIFIDNSRYDVNNVSVAATLANQVGFQHNATLRVQGASGSATFGTLYGFIDTANVTANTAGGVLNLGTRAAFRVNDLIYTATGTITVTDNVGLDLANMVVGTSGNRTCTNVYGVRSALTTGTNRWFLYATGNASSAHAGKLRLGTVAAPTELLELYAGNLYIAGGSSTGYIDLGEYATTTDAPAPAADRARLYVRDNGAGKEQACVRFATGAVQVLATEP